MRKRTLVHLVKYTLLAIALFVLVVEPLVLAEGDGVLSDFRTLVEVLALLKTHYVDPVNALDLAAQYVRHGTINGMLVHGLDDPYTRYLDQRAFQQLRVDTSGVFGGIGIVVGIRDDRLTIVSPILGTPGARAGLRGGDRIIDIDGTPTTYMSLDEAVSLMRGEVGTPVELGLERGDPESPDILRVRVIRDRIEVPTVERVQLVEPADFPALPAPVGYLHLTSFNQKTSGQLGQALAQLEEQGAQGLVLDMRNNPGGLLTAAIEVADRFLQGGPIVHVVGRNDRRQTIRADARVDFAPRPMVILVNGNSASAAEIVAGALRDRGHAILVGEQTFGKGLVQTLIPLRNGAGLSLTTARYQTAGGHNIHKTGITPDEVVEIPEDQLESLYESLQREKVDLSDPQLRRALEVLAEWMSTSTMPLAG